MKKLLSIVFFCLIGIIIFIKFSSKTQEYTPFTPSSQKASQNISTASANTTLFVPYWTLDGKAIPSIYTTIAYFGITANNLGIDTKEDGYKDIGQFVKSVNSHQHTLLVVRLEDQNIDEKILHNNTFSTTVINESLALARKYHFDGIVLDLEYKALAFDEVVQSVSNFSSQFAKASHKDGLTYYQTIYGDSMYRFRPFDVAAIGKVSDGIFVMAYDFHKADGNPGPNFPLNEMPDEQYSFQQMIQDFELKVPKDKLNIIFGMFGYDWTVDDKGQAINEAESLTTNQMLHRFIDKCLFPSCSVQEDKALEKEVTYKDKNNQKHIVWFEDLTSIAGKKDFLKTKGITSTAFWAYSYF